MQVVTRVPLSLYLGPRLVNAVSLREQPNSLYLQNKSERLRASGEVAAWAGQETARCTTYPVFLGVGLQAFTPVPQLSRVPLQLLNKPRRRALQTQPPPTHAPVARFYLTLDRWSSVACVG